MNYFTYDGGLQDLLQEAERQNQLRSENRTSLQSLLRLDILSTMHDTLSTSHQMITELQNIAAADAEQNKEAIVNISASNKFIGVAAFVNNSIAGDYSFRIKVKNNGAFEYHGIKNTDPKIEPLCYPLLFPCGELGFNPLKKNMRLPQYVAFRLLRPEPQLGSYNNESRIDFPLNRFIIMGRLMQYWLCETVCRAINFKLQYLQKNQDTLFGIHYDSDDNGSDGDNTDDDDEDGDKERQHFSSKNKSFLADSFTGSPRHLKKLSMNALTIVSEYGPPDAFITLTFNPMWKEVKQGLLPGQSIYDRPDLQARIFHARLEAFIFNLRFGKYYTDDMGNPIKLKYILRVIEYQNRGLPHCHIVIKLDDDHDPIRFMNRYCRATVSDLDESDDMQRKLKSLIQQHMLHKCSGHCLSNGICSRGYGKNKIVEHNQVDSKGFPIHRRLAEADFNIVPTHDKMILDWDGHINHEPAAQSFTVMYLFKYLFKGNKTQSVEIDGDYDQDEIKTFQRGKMLCASDAAWRMFGFQNYPKSTPSTVLIKIKTPMQIKELEDNKKVCDLLVYFSRLQIISSNLSAELRAELENSTYTAFFQKWIYKLSAPRKSSAQYCYEISIPFHTTNKRVFVVRRKQNGENIVVRMATVYITAGEPWYLRLLLLRKPASSFQDLLTVNGVAFTRFQDAAVKEGYVYDHTAAKICFDEMRHLKAPYELRVQFVTMTIAGYPTLLILDDQDCIKSMMADFLDENQHNWGLSYRLLLLDINRRFKAANVSMDDFGLPVPEDRISEIEYARLKYDVECQKNLYEACIQTSPFTTEMMVYMYDIISLHQLHLSD